MAMIEKLFVQIFERRSWIIDQVDQQARLFDQHLASKLLIDGITPPPWLLNSDLRSRTSNNTELNAEELISGVLLSRPRPPVPFSYSQRAMYDETVAENTSRGLPNGISGVLLSRPCPLVPFSYSQRAVYDETVAETTIRGLPNGLCTEMHAQNEDFDGREKTSAWTPNVAGLASAGVSTMDPSIISLEGQRDEDPSITLPQDQKDTRISDVNPDLALSLARLQRSRSRQKALEIRRSAKKNYLLEESNLANSLDAQNESCAVEGVESCAPQSKENSSRIDSGRITRSKISAQRQTLNVVDSSNAINKDNALTNTVVSSPQQSSRENPPLELVSESQVGETKARVGEKRKEVTRSSNDNRRITRSRKVSWGASTIESVPKALHPNDNEQIITGSVSTTSNRSRCSKGTQNVTEDNIDSRRTTRSRSMVPRDTFAIEPLLEAVHLTDNKHLIIGSLFTTSNRSRSGKGTQKIDEQSSSIREDEELCADNSTDSSDRETVAEEYLGTNRRAEPTSAIEVTSNVFNDQDLDFRVSLLMSAAPHKPSENKLSYSLAATGSKEVSSVNLEGLLCFCTKEPANLEGRASTLKEAEVDPGREVAAQYVSSGSNLNDASAAELEVLAPFPAESSMSVDHRKLNFDMVEPSTFKDISTPEFGNEAEEKLLEENVPPSSLGVACTVGNVVSENLLENDSLHLEERDELSPDEECPRDFSEANADVALNEQIEPSAKATPCKNNMVTCNLQQSNKYTKERLSLTVMNLNNETKTETPVGALPAEFSIKDVGLETLSNVHIDADFSLLTKPDHSGDQETCTDIELPCAVSKDENVLHAEQEIDDSNISECCTAESLERSTHYDTNVDCSHSSQRPKLQTEEVGFMLEERNSSANILFTFAYEELEASLVPSVVRKAGGDCQLHLMEEARETDPTSVITDGDLQDDFDNDDSYLLELEDRFGVGNSESLTGSETLTQEKKSSLAGVGKISFDADDTMPVLEGFILQSDDEQPCIVDEEITISNLNLPQTMIERAGILEKLCKSACIQTPVSYCSAPYKSNKVSNPYQSVPIGHLESMDVENKCPISEEFSCAFQGTPHSDSFQNSTIGLDWDIKKPCLSPVQKVWERIISKSASSEKRKSLSLELPCINEESESIEEVADTFENMDSDAMDCLTKREPLAEIDENLPVSEAELYADRFSLNSVTTEFSFDGTYDRTKNKFESGISVKRRFNNSSNKENENPSMGANFRNGIMRPLHNRFSKQNVSSSTISSKGGPGVTEMEPRRNNIVSNITSFIPFVQQKQSSITTGKRDVKVKALEAAEAAKRLAEKKENERKIKKEAMKLERARLEQENLKQLELQKKRKEEERKKKEADMAAKKRQREEEEKKEKERKRLRVEETQKQQKENEQKLQAAKEERDKSRIIEERGREAKERNDRKVNNGKIEKVKVDENAKRISETEPKPTRASTSEDRRAVLIREEFEPLIDLVSNSKGSDPYKPTATHHSVAVSTQEPSYDISPYKCSDEEDEDGDDDDDRPRKFVPSWASKKG